MFAIDSGSTWLTRQVYAGVFPIDGGEFNKLEEAIERVSFLFQARACEADDVAHS